MCQSRPTGKRKRRDPRARGTQRSRAGTRQAGQADAKRPRSRGTEPPRRAPLRTRHRTRAKPPTANQSDIAAGSGRKSGKPTGGNAGCRGGKGGRTRAKTTQPPKNAQTFNKKLKSRRRQYGGYPTNGGSEQVRGFFCTFRNLSSVNIASEQPNSVKTALEHRHFRCIPAPQACKRRYYPEEYELLFRLRRQPLNHEQAKIRHSLVM